MLLAHGVKGAVVFSVFVFSLFHLFPSRLSFLVLGRKCQRSGLVYWEPMKSESAGGKV
jgi:hypothetical protein